MKYRNHVALTLSLLICTRWSGSSLKDFRAGNKTAGKVEGTVAENVFHRCAFDFIDAEHISRMSHMSSGHNYRVSGYEDSCDMDLKTVGFHTLGGERTWLAIISPTKTVETTTSQGFDKSAGKEWNFKGNPMGIYFSKYKSITMKAVSTGDDITLIGRQMESGKDQAGTPGTFEGVHILRITADFLVAVDLPFAYSTSVSTRNAVLNDLIRVVRSVKSTSQNQRSTTPNSPLDIR